MNVEVEEVPKSGTSTSTKCMPQSERVYAQHIWPSSVHLAQFVRFNREKLMNRNVLELGCGGTALPGIMAIKSNANKVILSDAPDQTAAFELLRENLSENNISSENNPKISILGLNWHDFCSDSDSASKLGKIDIILAADCFYDAAVFEPCLRVISTIINLNPKCECWFAYQERCSDWSIDRLLPIYQLKCTLVTPDSYHAQCVKVTEQFERELKRHTILIGVLTLVN